MYMHIRIYIYVFIYIYIYIDMYVYAKTSRPAALELLEPLPTDDGMAVRSARLLFVPLFLF